MSSGCVTSSRIPVASNWSALGRAQEMECAPFPVAEDKVIAMESMSLYEANGGIAVSEVLLRDASQSFIQMPLRDSIHIPAHKVGSIELSPQSLVVGELFKPEASYLVVITRSKTDESWLTLRSVGERSQNQGRYRLPFSVAQASFVAASKNAGWLLFKRSSETKSVQDIEVEMAFLKFNQETQSLVSKVTSLAIGVEFPKLVWDARYQLGRLLWKGETSGKDQFFSAVSDPEGNWSQPSDIDLPISSMIESWSLSLVSGVYRLAFVDGDSFAGDASLKVAELSQTKDQRFQVRWVATKSLLSQQVSQPVWVSANDEAYLLLPKWRDAESTLANYKLVAGGIESLPDTGVFPQGVQVIGGTLLNSASMLVVLQSGADLGLNFRLCQIDMM